MERNYEQEIEKQQMNTLFKTLFKLSLLNLALCSILKFGKKFYDIGVEKGMIKSIQLIDMSDILFEIAGTLWYIFLAICAGYIIAYLKR